MNRRRYLAGTGSVVAVGTAGGYAVGRAGGDNEDEDGEPTETENDGEPTTDEAEEEPATDDEEPSIRTILHLTSGDEADHDRALTNLENLLTDETTDTDAVEFVVNGPAISVYVADETDHADRIRALADDGVAFKGCANSLEGFGIEESELLEEATVIPASVGEIATLQTEGYGYIKVP
ncbi:DsrE family protein [Natronococcus sp.]|uniref:DsrE family protein n=1 Tax=Natronococcus sp. TaxID=35747 RepID=UPI0025CFE05D|nr:DsrE family protein [Natronococcus sp.]